MNQYENKSLEVYWNKEKGIHYLNSGSVIDHEKALEGIAENKYEKVSLSWEGGPENGPLNVSTFREMQKIRSRLEGLIKNS